MLKFPPLAARLPTLVCLAPRRMSRTLSLRHEFRILYRCGVACNGHLWQIKRPIAARARLPRPQVRHVACLWERRPRRDAAFRKATSHG